LQQLAQDASQAHFPRSSQLSYGDHFVSAQQAGFPYALEREKRRVAFSTPTIAH
jgi:hypothetical protein